MIEGHDFRAARDLLFELRTDYEEARKRFRWPQLEHFNWALDWFDVGPPAERTALWVVEEDGSEARRTFGELRARSNQVANLLRSLGVRRGDRVLVMLGNEIALWEAMLGAMKLGAVVIPAATRPRSRRSRRSSGPSPPVPTPASDHPQRRHLGPLLRKWSIPH